MKKILFVFIIVVIGLQACKEQELPESMELSKTPFIGTWKSGERQTILSNPKIGENNITYYVDSLITEKIDMTMEFVNETDLTITVVKYSNDGTPSSPLNLNTKWSAGQTTNSEYLRGQKYIIVFDPTKPHQQKTDEWLNTYTIESVSGNQMTLVWTLQDKTAKNSKRFTASFSK
jgi:hypothetical protein